MNSKGSHKAHNCGICWTNRWGIKLPDPRFTRNHKWAWTGSMVYIIYKYGWDMLRLEFQGLRFRFWHFLSLVQSVLSSHNWVRYAYDYSEKPNLGFMNQNRSTSLYQWEFQDPTDGGTLVTVSTICLAICGDIPLHKSVKWRSPSNKLQNTFQSISVPARAKSSRSRSEYFSEKGSARQPSLRLAKPFWNVAAEPTQGPRGRASLNQPYHFMMNMTDISWYI